MELTDTDHAILKAVAEGLPLVAAPYAAVARRLGVTEDVVLQRLAALQASGAIKRFGIVVKHRALGYRANAMAVWDVPDSVVDGIAEDLAARPEVTLCYRRRRCPPRWPYNLFCMIHGKDRSVVEALLDRINELPALRTLPHARLFSRRCFKQQGALLALRDAA